MSSASSGGNRSTGAGSRTVTTSAGDVVPEAGDAALARRVAVVERTLPGVAGPIPARVYRPVGADRPLPVVLYFPAIPWSASSSDSAATVPPSLGVGATPTAAPTAATAAVDRAARELAESAQATVVAVEFRRPPAGTERTASDDAFAAYRWARENASSIAGDPYRIAVVGEELGGTAALTVSRRSQETGRQLPDATVAIAPAAPTDTVGAGAGASGPPQQGATIIPAGGTARGAAGTALRAAFGRTPPRPAATTLR